MKPVILSRVILQVTTVAGLLMGVYPRHFIPPLQVLKIPFLFQKIFP